MLLRYTDIEVIIMNWDKWKRYIPWILTSEAVGALSGFLSRSGMKMYESAIAKPQLSPPGWLFPVVWSLLYLLMGVASYRVWVSASELTKKQNALFFYILQLAFNFLWSLIFFNAERYLFAFFWLIGLWALVYITERKFERIDRLSGYLLLPYLVWVAFAGYLNIGIYFLN